VIDMGFGGFLKEMSARAIGLLAWWVIGGLVVLLGLLTVVSGLDPSTDTIPPLVFGVVIMFVGILAIVYGTKKHDKTIRF